MKNKSGLALAAALLIGVLFFAVSTVSFSAQTKPAPPPFGSSLKRPKVEPDNVIEEKTSPSAEKNPAQPEEVYRIDTSLVNLNVLVTDASGSRYIPGLTKDDFVVMEDNEPQTVATVTVGDDAAGLPRSIVLIFDRSESELPYLESSIDAAKALVNQLAPSDEMAIVTDDVELASGFSKDKKKLKQTLDSLKKLSLEGYRTRSMQFSALLATLRELIDSSRKRPIIIFQTDGDEAPRWDKQRPTGYDLDTVYAEVEKSRTKIYTVIPNVKLLGIPREEVAGRLQLIRERGEAARARHKDMWYGYERLPPKPKPNNTGSHLAATRIPPELMAGLRVKLIEEVSNNLVKGQTAAARVADLTGGWTSFLEKQEQASEIYQRILADINHTYVISYYPTNKNFDAKLRNVRIEVRGHRDYVVHGRTSYYAMPR